MYESIELITQRILNKSQLIKAGNLQLTGIKTQSWRKYKRKNINRNNARWSTGNGKIHCSALNIDNFYLYKMKVTIYQFKQKLILYNFFQMLSTKAVFASSDFVFFKNSSIECGGEESVGVMYHFLLRK